MRTIYLVDTTIFLNVLDIPGFNQDKGDIINRLGQLFRDSSVNLLLPMAAIIETGNHIAHLPSGGNRRRFAQKYVDQVKLALLGEAPWTLTQNLQFSEMIQWIDEFPDHAMRKVGMGDLTIIKEWELACGRHPNDNVTIWSLDAGLQGYDRRRP